MRRDRRLPRRPGHIAYHDALAIGDTLGAHRGCVHWVAAGKARWIAEQRAASWRILAVEACDGATPLHELAPARERTAVLLGHEHRGVPDDVLAGADERLEIPMLGRGGSLNVAVAGSLVAYRLAGLA